MIGKTNAVTITQSGNYQSKSVTISSGGTTSVSADVGYDALSQVDITTPAGSATTPTTTITESPTFSLNSSTGVVTASYSKTQAVTPTVVAGYISSGTAGNITISGSKTYSLPTKGATTYSPSTTAQTIAAGQFLTGTQTIAAMNLESITDTISTNTTTTYTPSVGYDGIESVVITTSVPTTVNLQTKSITIASSGTQQITADGGYDGLQEVDITTPSGTATTPATTITKNPTITVSGSGLITASYSGSQNVTPTVSTGWVSSGTAGTITVSGSNTQQLTTQSAQTLYPSSTDQTISSGRFLTGNQTIKAVTTTNLSSSYIKSGVTVEVGDADDPDRVLSVTGSYTGSSYTLIATQQFTVSTTSTTASSVGTMNLGSTGWTGDKILYIKVRDNAGTRNGYFSGTDSWIMNYYAAMGATASVNYGVTLVHTNNTSTTSRSYSMQSAYGIYPYSLNSDGDLRLYKRYNSTITRTINGTYTVEVYLVDYAPNTGNPFDY